MSSCVLFNLTHVSCYHGNNLWTPPCLALFQLSNHQFEELAMDVYDEVDRRETDAGESSLYIFYPPLPYLRRVHLPLCILSNLPPHVWRLLPSVWLVTQNHSTLVSDATVVPFLPVNPEYSSTRNQASTVTAPSLRSRAGLL